MAEDEPEKQPPAPEQDPSSAAVTKDLWDLLNSHQVQEIDELPSSAELARRDQQQDIELKKSYARGLLWMMTGQLAVADAVFIAYAWIGEDWHVTAGVMQVWLAATVVQVIGVALVVVRYLFPRRDVL
jgi:hypothetical protein